MSTLVFDLLKQIQLQGGPVTDTRLTTEGLSKFEEVEVGNEKIAWDVSDGPDFGDVDAINGVLRRDLLARGYKLTETYELRRLEEPSAEVTARRGGYRTDYESQHTVTVRGPASAVFLRLWLGVMKS